MDQIKPGVYYNEKLDTLNYIEIKYPADTSHYADINIDGTLYEISSFVWDDVAGLNKDNVWIGEF